MAGLPSAGPRTATLGFIHALRVGLATASLLVTFSSGISATAALIRLRVSSQTTAIESPMRHRYQDVDSVIAAHRRGVAVEEGDVEYALQQAAIAAYEGAAMEGRSEASAESYAEKFVAQEASALRRAGLKVPNNY